MLIPCLFLSFVIVFVLYLSFLIVLVSLLSIVIVFVSIRSPSWLSFTFHSSSYLFPSFPFSSCLLIYYPSSSWFSLPTLFIPTNTPSYHVPHFKYSSLKNSTTRSQSSYVVRYPSEIRTPPAITPFTTVSAD